MKITFMGAGSTIFVKNIMGDVFLTESLRDVEVALYDIDQQRLEDSRQIVDSLNQSINEGRATVSAYFGEEQRKDALRGAIFVIDAIQVGGYRPCTVTDFEIPNRFGLRQTIGDTIGIGGIFRALRTIPVLDDFARDMEEVCPDAWFFNYTNPMSILTGYMLKHTGVKTVGLCHSVQVCVPELLEHLKMTEYIKGAKWSIAGINHMAWLLDISHSGKDLYPEIRRRAEARNVEFIAKGKDHGDLVRFEMMKQFGFYTTESSEHSAEYHPYFIKESRPELIDRFKIPLDEYPRRCEKQIQEWKETRERLLKAPELEHSRSREYAAGMMNAVVTDSPFEIGGNVMNNGLISNLPADACVEVPCIVNRNGVQGVYVGRIPSQLAALNQTHINVHQLAVEAAATRSREAVYHAAMMDPHTRAELDLDQIREMCDALFAAHADWLPVYK
ncbi:alpha-glucosidase/alpha-galactosidase [Tichowtungia aerotolerans]|uniref:Alpha-galactosidase n=1 Tax=Tichowtungia aerotolerans TaxID=2697043 RepID=A0A6P1LZS2_9BACT|nr:alpha-glucosidase/alpha-galactosidase [Tichowtungia aerotolerans]QHI68039.1 alpha-galactosidase [Tichowtungia aerotolerans]